MAPNETAFQLISFLASISSLIVEIGAIALSMVFFQWSNKAVNATTDAANDIGASVARLEKLFDHLYSDTFAMMRETVSELQKHAWDTQGSLPEGTTAAAVAAAEEAETKADEKISEIRGNVDAQLSDILARQEHQRMDMQRLRHEMKSLVDQAISDSRQVDLEAREQTTREYLLRLIRNRKAGGREVTAGDLSTQLKLAPDQLKAELDQLNQEGIIRLFPPSPPAEFGPDTKIRMVLGFARLNARER
jgi:hypothetical protein